MSSILQSPKWELKGQVCSLYLQNQDKKPKFRSWVVSKISDHIQIKIKIPNPSWKLPTSSKALNQDTKDMDFLCTFKIKMRSQRSEDVCIQYQNQDQDPKPQSGTFRIPKIPKSGLKGHGHSLHLQNQNIEQKIQILGISKTSYHIKIKMKMPNPKQEPPASSRSPNHDLKDMDVLCTFKI